MPKRATLIVLSEKEQEGLLQITRRHRNEQQVVLRARIVLAAAQGHPNVQIASELDTHVDTVRLWLVIEVCNAGGCGHLSRLVCAGKTPTSTNKPRWKR